MSRTDKDRPYWVIQGDPEMHSKSSIQTYHRHNHLTPYAERIGNSDSSCGSGLHGEECWRHWNERVPCDLHVPESRPVKFRSMKMDQYRELKRCAIEVRYYPNQSKKRQYKKMRNLEYKKFRTSIRDQIRQTMNEQSWEDADIFTERQNTWLWM